MWLGGEWGDYFGGWIQGWGVDSGLGVEFWGGGLGLPLSEVPLRSILRLASLSEVPQRQIG